MVDSDVLRTLSSSLQSVVHRTRQLASRYGQRRQNSRLEELLRGLEIQSFTERVVESLATLGQSALQEYNEDISGVIGSDVAEFWDSTVSEAIDSTREDNVASTTEGDDPEPDQDTVSLV